MGKNQGRFDMTKLLTLDLSTTCTGFAIFDLQTKKLERYGFIKPNKKGMSKLEYPKKQLYVMRDLAAQIKALVDSIPDLKMILLEEVNLHKSRMAGKTLDGAHWILLNSLDEFSMNKVRYRDSDGETGWRTRLNLRLSEMDKKLNAERKKLNKKLRPKDQLPIINKKHLAARYVNSKLGTNFDVDQNSTDNDVVDAIGLGLSEILTLE